MGLYTVCSACKLATGYLDLLYVHPMRHRNPLRGECLELFDSVERRVVQEATDQFKAFVIGYVCGRFLAERFAIEVM